MACCGPARGVHSTGKPKIGTPNMLRPGTSAVISATTPRISSDPTTLLICVSGSSTVKRQGYGALPA